MMAFFLADAAYLLSVLLLLAVFILSAEWLVHALPGSALNPLRRLLFRACFPLLKWSESFLLVKWGNFHFRGLLLAVLLLMLERYGVPWLVLLSYSWRG